jgi:hypothetical protein
MFEVPDTLIAAFPPSADLLLDRARRETDDAMLREIAEADYGWRADEMVPMLQLIRDKGVVPAPMPRILGAVLNLTQFSNPDKANASRFQPDPKHRRGHQARVFACAVLLRAEAELPPEADDFTAESALPQCLASANVLGEEMSEAAARFLTWRISRQESGLNSLSFALGLVVLAIRLRSGRFTGQMLGTIADWVLRQAPSDMPEFPLDPTAPRPLPIGLQSSFWRPLAAELSSEAEAIRENDVRSKLHLCEALLESGPSYRG